VELTLHHAFIIWSPSPMAVGVDVPLAAHSWQRGHAIMLEHMMPLASLYVEVLSGQEAGSALLLQSDAIKSSSNQKGSPLSARARWVKSVEVAHEDAMREE